MDATYIFYAITIGLIPALLWLWFWLHEDSTNPEPKHVLIISFVAGMFAAPLAALMQLGAQKLFPDGGFLFSGVFISTYIIVWVIAEELVKFAASFYALRNKAMDEPIDPMIYLITSALGFVAVENTLYALQALTKGGVEELLSSGISRFVGPSLVHIVTSGIVGLSIALGFYIHGQRKRMYIYIGLFTAILLHTIYNLLIIVNTQRYTIIAFTSVWICAIILMLAFEIVKKLKKR